MAASAAAGGGPRRTAHDAQRRVDERAQGQRQGSGRRPRRRRPRPGPEDQRVHHGRREQDQAARPRLRELEARARHAHREAHQHLGQPRQAQHRPAELHVLHPARGRARQHAVRLAEDERAVDHHQQEEIQQAGAGRQDLGQRRLHEQGRHRAPAPSRRPSLARVSVDARRRKAAGSRTTMTSSSLSKCAEGATAISLNSPVPSAPSARGPPPAPGIDLVQARGDHHVPHHHVRQHGHVLHHQVAGAATCLRSADLARRPRR